MVDQDNIDQRCSFVGRAARYARIGPPRTMPTLERPALWARFTVFLRVTVFLRAPPGLRSLLAGPNRSWPAGERPTTRKGRRFAIRTRWEQRRSAIHR